jgi:hypothetical protein
MLMSSPSIMLFGYLRQDRPLPIYRPRYQKFPLPILTSLHKSQTVPHYQCLLKDQKRLEPVLKIRGESDKMKLITMLDALYGRLLHENEGLHFNYINMHIRCKEILLDIVNHENANDAFEHHPAYRGGFKDLYLPCAASWTLW